MTSTRSRATDREAEVTELFRTRLRDRLARLVTADVVAEHRAAPRGAHSPALAAVLVALRQAPVEGKLALLQSPDGSGATIIRLSGRPGVAHTVVDPRRFADLDEAAHAVFLMRLEELGIDTAGLGS